MSKIIRWGITCLLLFGFLHATAQEESRPEMAAGELKGPVQLDGRLDEADWSAAPLNDQLKTTVPVEGGEPSGRTTIRVLAGPKALIIGIECFDNDPSAIVSFSKLRDADLENEDHIRIVIDPFLDGQSGYIFAVNANGARYDALVSRRGESENDDWDAIWEAMAQINDNGWTMEVRIPIQSISFKKGLTKWGFNVERRVQRFQETIRWANVRRDQWFIQTSRAGLLTNLPEFNYGLGLNVRPSLIADVTRTGGKDGSRFTLDPSLDASQRIGPNITATITANTDFAETEVDTRQTNLTRFPLFFPEKRAFFLEGADIFEFGFGLSRNIIPFFSRRLGLYRGNEVPILAGGKVNGRVGKTSFGAMTMHTRETEAGDYTLPSSTMGVVRVKHNVLKESSVGIIGTLGDPQSRGSAATAGADFTYQSTRFRGDKNLIVGASVLHSNRADIEGGEQSAFVFKADYPNDLWDIALTYMRIGESFDPALGFVPRKAINSTRVGLTYAPRPSWKWLRQMRNQLYMTYITDLKGDWESYSIFTAPINWRLESGDRVEANFWPKGERLVEPFEIADEVVIPAGEYHFVRWRLEMEMAAKRRFNGQLSWWFGSFYEGNLHELEASINWNPAKILTFEFIGVRNVGRLPFGDFDQTLAGVRARFNVTPDLQINSFLQYDTDTKTFGINARIHWIYHPQGDIFLVFNHNTYNGMERWSLINEQVLLKARYNFRL